MPTMRPRHPVTETDQVAAVLDEAERCWPGEPRSRLIVRVLLDWQKGGRSPSSRRAAMDALVGSSTWPEIYDKNSEWPE